MKISMKNLIQAALSATALFAVGCGAPTPKEVATKAGDDVTALVKEAMITAESSNNMTAVSELQRTVFAIQGNTTSQPNTMFVPAASGADNGLAEMKKFLVDKVFTDANVESSGGGSVTFLIQGDDICGGNSTATPDATCVKQVNAVGVRVRATSTEGDGLDLTLIIGTTTKVEPLIFKIRPRKSLALEVKLAEAKSALEQVNAAIGGKGLGLELFSVAGGVEWKLTKNGEKDFTASMAFTQDVKVDVGDGTGIRRVFTSAAKNPVSSLRVEALPRRATVAIDFGVSSYSGPASDFSSSAMASIPFNVTLGGYSGSLTAEEGQKEFALAHLGLGDVTSSMTWNNAQVLGVDLNQKSGRHFDLTFARDVDNKTTITVSPEVDFSAKLAFKNAPELKASSWAQDETIHASLAPAGSKPAFKVLPSSGTFAGGIQLLSGAFLLESTAPGAKPVGVAVGQCLTTSGSMPNQAHELLGTFNVVTCPQ